MKFTVGSREDVVDLIADRINRRLAKGSVLWLLSGGSNIELETQIRSRLDLKNQLTVGLIDERYGEAAHADSNWQQLLDTGFDTHNITVMPVLHDESIEATTQNYQIMLLNAAKNHDTTVGLFGLGTDGHTAGILPGSTSTGSKDIVTFYKGPDYHRITLTPLGFKYIDEALLVAFGSSKHAQLKRLQHEQPVSVQPAQALKKIKNLMIYTDQGYKNEK